MAARVWAIALIAACSGRTPSAGTAEFAGAPSATSATRATRAPSATAGPLLAAAFEAQAGAPARSAPAPAPAGPTQPAAPAQVTLADVGLEVSSLDRSSDPCVDFYQFACGGWIQNNPIPADRPSWGRGSELDLRNKAAIRALLERRSRENQDDKRERAPLERGIKQPAADPDLRKLGDFYASCMDDAAIERAGTTAFKTLLAKTQGVKDARSWLAALVELHRLGVFVVWNNLAFPDLKNSSINITYLDAAGLGLPDRDYYVKPELKDKLEGYRAHVGRMLALLPGARLAAGDVVAIESELAALTKTAVELRDVPASYNPTDLRALGRQVKSVDWPAYWKGLGVAPSKKLVVGTPRFFAGLDRLRARFKPAQWASYFTFHLVERFAYALPRAFDDEALELQKLLSGVEKQRDRDQRCIDHTTTILGEMLGQQYVARHFPASSRDAAVKLVDAIAHAMSDEIAALDWMAAPTRQIAVAKLARIARLVGYPDRWKTYDFAIKRDDFAGNMLRGIAFETRRQLAKSGKPPDRGEWQLPAYQVDAYYEPTANSAQLPAGILQPPFFGQDRALAANLGAIGMVIGHELTHAFDDQGAQYDGDGNLKNWWQKDDLARFGEKASCVADQYSTFEALPRKFIQGRLTLGENIADMGGVKMAFKTLRALRKDAPRTYVADGFTEEQQFFIAVAQIWCARERPADVERRLTADPHAPPKFRVYGALRNLPDFADAFHCAPGTPMRPAKTCTVW